MPELPLSVSPNALPESCRRPAPGAARRRPVGRRRGGRKGALAVQLVLVSIIVTVTTVLTVAASVIRLLNPRDDQGRLLDLADVLVPVLNSSVPLILAGAFLGFLLSLRVRKSIASIAEATARLYRGDTDAPIPQAEDIELAPLTEAVARVQAFIRTQKHSQIRAAGIEGVRERALLASLRDPVITTSDDGRVTGFNAAAIAIFGKLEAHYGRPLQALLPFVPAALPGESNREAVTGPQAAWQGVATDARGRGIDLDVSRTPLAEGNLPASDAYVVHDVSRYAELNRLRTQLVMDVVYELRAPLSTIDTALDMLTMDGDDGGGLGPEEVAQLVQPAHRSAARLRRLIDDLITSSKIQAGGLAPDARPTLVDTIVEDALAAVDAYTARHAQRIDCRLPGQPSFVLVDRPLACQLLANLLANACRRSATGQAVALSAEPVNRQVRFAVQDSGVELTPDQQARLLGQIDRERAAGEEPGLGLELTIATGIVQAHGGRIGVESSPGAGTRIWFTLPAAPFPGEPAAPAPVLSQAVAATA